MRGEPLSAVNMSGMAIGPTLILTLDELSALA